jgi:hypothetical protein
MFDEVPSPPAPPSPRTAIRVFASYLVLFLVGLTVALLRWSGPMSLRRKITTGEFVLCGILAGVFLLTAKSVSPEGNRKRMMCLLLVFLVFQITVSALQ